MSEFRMTVVGQASRLSRSRHFSPGPTAALGYPIQPSIAPHGAMKELAMDSRVRAPRSTSTVVSLPDRQCSALDHRYSAYEQHGRQLANTYRANLWALGEWWIEGKRCSRERAALVNSPDWPVPNAARLRTIAYVVRRMAKTSFQKDISFGHHEAVASLDQGTATQFLRRAIDGGWSVKTLKGAVAAHRQSVPTPNDITMPHALRRYTTILADPPWKLNHPIVDGRYTDIIGHCHSMTSSSCPSATSQRGTPICFFGRQIRCYRRRSPSWTPRGFVTVPTWPG